MATTAKKATPAKRAPAKTTRPRKPAAPAAVDAAPDDTPARPPARKAPSPRKAAARKATPAETTDATPAEITAEIVFRGRTIAVRPPNPEQMAVYQRTADRFARLQDDMRAGKLDGEAAVKALARAIGIVQSVMVDEHDREWVETELLDRRLELVDVQPIVRSALDALTEKHGNRAARRRVRAAD